MEGTTHSFSITDASPCPNLVPQPATSLQAGSILKGEVRCACPLPSTRGADPSSRVFARALFIMDYRDSDLFHLLEVRGEEGGGREEGGGGRAAPENDRIRHHRSAPHA